MYEYHGRYYAGLSERPSMAKAGATSKESVDLGYLRVLVLRHGDDDESYRPSRFERIVLGPIQLTTLEN
jgi:hypothetical protein